MAATTSWGETNARMHRTKQTDDFIMRKRINGQGEVETIAVSGEGADTVRTVPTHP